MNSLRIPEICYIPIVYFIPSRYHKIVFIIKKSQIIITYYLRELKMAIKDNALKGIEDIISSN